jgi:crotonobetaine/carnitine-CoA ligase
VTRLPERTFAELLTELPAGGAVVTSDGRLEARDVVDLAARAAGALAELGVRRGDRLAVMLHNQQAILAAWFGSAWAGVTFVPINTRLRGEILRYTIQHSEPAALIVADDLVAATARELASAVRIIPAGDWSRAVVTTPAIPLAPSTERGCIFYTSGTTGRPKGVVWHPVTQARHAWLYARELVALEPGEVGYTGFPLFHVQSMGVAMSCLQNGATAYVDPRFSATQFWPRVRETRATMFAYMGAMLAILLKAPPGPADRDHQLRYAMGAAATPELWRAFEARFGLTLLECYGQTEMSTCWSANPVGSGRIGSIGPFADRATIRLQPVGDGSPVGLLLVRPRAPHLMMEGYFRDPEATRAVMEDGWYNSRDLVRADPDGWLYYVGRVTDSIRRRGEHVSAYEIEQVVVDHPDLLEVAVVGVASDLTEQDVALYYVRRPGLPVDPRALAEWCRARLSDFMVPRHYREVAALPKTETARVQKAVLTGLPVLTAFDAERGVRDDAPTGGSDPRDARR